MAKGLDSSLGAVQDEICCDANFLPHNRVGDTRVQLLTHVNQLGLIGRKERDHVRWSHCLCQGSVDFVLHESSKSFHFARQRGSSVEL